MLANSALSDGHLAHITCQQQQAQADYRAAATMLRIWLAGGSAQSKTEPLFELVQ